MRHYVVVFIRFKVFLVTLLMDLTDGIRITDNLVREQIRNPISKVFALELLNRMSVVVLEPFVILFLLFLLTRLAWV